MLVNRFKEVFLLFIYELQNSIETKYLVKTKETIFWLNGDRLKIIHYESYRKTNHKREHIIREYQIFGQIKKVYVSTYKSCTY